MWPILLDMTREESMQNLRCLELDAFAGLVTAFRAQGCLNPEKLRLLRATGNLLNIPLDRHKAEIRRAVNDEKLNTIAYHTAGHKASLEDWTQEGRRLIPLLSRVAPQTVYSAIADEVADTASRANKLLPHPACTERKRSAPASPTSVCPGDSNKTFRATVQDSGITRIDDAKKRKVSPTSNDILNSVESGQLMGPPKGNRAQPLNRLRAKIKQKDNLQLFKIRQQHVRPDTDRSGQQLTTSYTLPIKPQASQPSVCNFSTLKTAQSLPPITGLMNSSVLDQTPPNLVSPLNSSSSNPESCFSPSTCVTTPPHVSPIDNNKPSLNATLLPNKMIKVCPPRKTVTTNTGQKLVVVSNPQSIPSTSILQRTLTIPFVKNISVKNYDKFKIVPPSSNMQISSLFTSNTTTIGLNHFKNNTKHKVVTVRTNSGGNNNNKTLPFSQIQMLNSKGAIKVLPFGSKLLMKQTASSSSSNINNQIYVVNSMANSSKTSNIITADSQSVYVKQSTIPETNHLNPSKALLHSSVSYFDSEIASDPSVDESSSESSSDSMTNVPSAAETLSSTVEKNHRCIKLNSVSNHVVEEDDGDGTSEGKDEEVDNHEDEEVDTEDGDTNESFKAEEDTAVAEETQQHYVIENSHETVEAEVLEMEHARCIVEQLEHCTYTELDSNDIQLQEELVSLECEPTMESGISADTDAVLDYNSF